MNQRAFFNWSGGKDSAFALYHVLQEKNFNLDCLITTVNSEYKRVSMHGVREELLDLQANSIGIPLKKFTFLSMFLLRSTITFWKKILKILKTRVSIQLFSVIFFSKI